MRSRFGLLLSVAALFLFTTSVWASPSICNGVVGNLVTNCGFESGAFVPGWTQGGNTGFTGVSGNQNSGNYAAFLGPVGSNGTLTQTIIGSSTIYSLGFYLSNGGGGPVENFDVLWNGTSIFALMDQTLGFPYTCFNTGGGCTNPALTLAGNVGANTLEFVFRQDPNYWYLDDVVVTQGPSVIPEPSSFLLLGTGLIGVAGAMRRKLAF